MMTARLQCDVGGCTFGLRRASQRLQCVDFGMIEAECMMIPLANELLIFDQNTTDHGIGFDHSLATGGQRESDLHPVLITACGRFLIGF